MSICSNIDGPEDDIKGAQGIIALIINLTNVIINSWQLKEYLTPIVLQPIKNAYQEFEKGPQTLVGVNRQRKEPNLGPENLLKDSDLYLLNNDIKNI